MAFSLHHLLLEAANRRPEATALSFRGEDLSFAGLTERSSKIANFLIAHGVGRGDRVGLYMHRSFDCFAALYGILQAGAAYVALDSAAPVRLLNQMVNLPEDRLNATFAALSDPTRRAIVARLVSGEASVSELAEPHAMSLPAISKHLRVLESARLVRRDRRGRVRKCRLLPDPLREAETWIAVYRQFWDQQLAGLATYLRAAYPQPPEEDQRY